MNKLKCSECKKMLPISSFYENRSNKRGYQYSCMECKIEINKEAYQKKLGDLQTTFNTRLSRYRHLIDDSDTTINLYIKHCPQDDLERAPERYKVSNRNDFLVYIPITSTLVTPLDAVMYICEKMKWSDLLPLMLEKPKEGQLFVFNFENFEGVDYAAL